MLATNGKIALDEQKEIISECARRDIPLADALAQRGLTYDSLRYVDYLGFGMERDNYMPIEDIEKFKPSIPAVSFFSGGGGLDIGFEYAGFKNLASIEHNEAFCATLRVNYPDRLVIGPPDHTGDVSSREDLYDVLTRVASISPDFEGVFHGGPPCQSFSIAANQRFSKNGSNYKRTGFEDPEKGTLLFDFLWFISQFRPKAFLIENVDGITDCDTDGRIHDELTKLAALGYTVYPPVVVNAADYGIPQNRMRWMILGTRGSKQVKMPKPVNNVASCYGALIRPLDGLKCHITREHAGESVSRYMILPYGGRDKLGRVDRLNPFRPSKTIIAGGTKGGGRSHLHPYTPRTLSVRECARLQTFPDSYVFSGATARQFTQVGNAVPPLLAYRFALAIKDAM